MRTTYFAAAMLAIRQALFHANPSVATAMQPVIILLVAQIAMYTQAANNHRNLDRLLYDIPEEEYRYRRTQTPRKHLRIASLPDDRTAEKMTSFNISQLHSLYVSSLPDGGDAIEWLLFGAYYHRAKYRRDRGGAVAGDPAEPDPTTPLALAQNPHYLKCLCTGFRQESC